MKKLLLILCLFVTFLTFSQEVKTQKQPFTYQTEQLAIGKAVPTTKYVIVKGQKYILYQTERHSYYYIIKNKKGEYLRRYIKQ